MNDNILKTDSIENQTPNILFYYTGTGNSLWLARVLARKLGNTQLISMSDTARLQMVQEPASMVGLIFPVHAWGLPRRVLIFLEYLEKLRPVYCFALANHGGQVSNTLVQLGKELKQRHINLSAGWEIKMPDNYIIWSGAIPVEKQKERFLKAEEKLSDITRKVMEKSELPPEKGPLWQTILLSAIYRASYPYFPTMDKYFEVDERCNHCGICVKICPVQNISFIDKHLTWHNRCEQCLACIQWCPQESLQFGKRTKKFARYNHPEIEVKDMIISSD